MRRPSRPMTISSSPAQRHDPGRELYTVKDRPQNFCMIGSMGLGLSIGLGLALAPAEATHHRARPGDGCALLRRRELGSRASASSARPTSRTSCSTTDARVDGRPAHHQRRGSPPGRSPAAASCCATHRAVDGRRLPRPRSAPRRTQPGPVMVLGVVEPGTDRRESAAWWRLRPSSPRAFVWRHRR